MRLLLSVCPEHGISDCSPLLNGCSYFSGQSLEESYSGLEESIEAHPVGKRVSVQQRALLDAKKWSTRIEIARDGYALALAQCRDAGLGNSVIARAVGKSETAVRMHFRRRENAGVLEVDPMQMSFDDMESGESDQ